MTKVKQRTQNESRKTTVMGEKRTRAGRARTLCFKCDLLTYRAVDSRTGEWTTDACVDLSICAPRTGNIVYSALASDTCTFFAPILHWTALFWSLCVILSLALHENTNRAIVTHGRAAIEQCLIWAFSWLSSTDCRPVSLVRRNRISFYLHLRITLFSKIFRLAFLIFWADCSAACCFQRKWRQQRKQRDDRKRFCRSLTI